MTRKRFTMKDVDEFSKQSLGYRTKFNSKYNEKLGNYLSVKVSDFENGPIVFRFWAGRKYIVRKVYISNDKFLIFKAGEPLELELNYSAAWNKFLAEKEAIKQAEKQGKTI